MIQLLISPAKSMQSLPVPDLELESTSPKFLKEASLLVEKMREFSAKELQEGMKISDKLAKLNWQRYQDWTPNPNKNHSAPAVQLFTGDVYQGLETVSWTLEDWKESQERVRILSGLYGLLRPLDRICPYRLEMGNKMQDLYTFWKNELIDELNKSTDPLVNLASNEYAKAVDQKSLKRPWIDIDFYENTLKGMRIIGIHAKKARGKMARYIVKNRIENIEDLKDFHDEGYTWYPEKSSENHFIFVR